MPGVIASFAYMRGVLAGMGFAGKAEDEATRRPF
jgi:hypothetical protein